MGELRHDPYRQARSPVNGAAERLVDDDRSVADLRIRLFGAIRLIWRGHEVRLAGRNARALIAILAMERRPRFRESIATDLWPDLGEAEAGSALRQSLWLLKGAMGEAGVDPSAILDSDKERIGLQAEDAIDLDVARFESCMRGHPVLVEEALELYGGDLAEGVSLECFSRDRERLADLFEDALAEASQRRLLDGDLAGAREAAVRLLRLDPLREEAHTVLIELHGLTGSRSQVWRQYRRLRAILATELDVEPLAETDTAFRIAMRRAAARSDHRAAWAAGSERAVAGTRG